MTFSLPKATKTRSQRPSTPFFDPFFAQYRRSASPSSNADLDPGRQELLNECPQRTWFASCRGPGPWSLAPEAVARASLERYFSPGTVGAPNCLEGSSEAGMTGSLRPAVHSVIHQFSHRILPLGTWKPSENRLDSGQLVMELPLDNGGTLQVTSHVASECNPPPGEEEGSFQDSYQSH